MKTLAIIPARSGSKGIKDKNIKILGTKPLLAYSIHAAKQSCLFDEIMVSTDCAKYAEIAKQYGANVPFLRSKKNSGDNAKSIDCILEVLQSYKDRGRYFDILIFLQPTSPFRDSNDIRNAFDFFMQHNLQDLCSIHKVQTNPLLLRKLGKNNQLEKILHTNSTRRRQDVEQLYKVNGAIYINKIKTITESTSLNDNPLGFEIAPLNGLDIDTQQDWDIAVQSLSKKSFD